MTSAAGDTPGRTPVTTRPTDGSCSHWIGARRRYCWAREGVRPYIPGHRCPAHTPAALRGLPEPPDNPSPLLNKESA
ncbi:hypothetical protein [Actinacidiphila sp. bgisy145]|uniref:hypothetical protein n=1 Tax=Actinacidiphila sp. bgisy145 TaxID=3413792 RepID=UPI003EBAFA7D